MGRVSGGALMGGGPLAFIPSPPASGIHLGPLHIHAYGLMYVIGVALALFVTKRRWVSVGGDPSLPYDVALWAVPAGIIGARVFFDITTPFDITPHTWWGPLAVWNGGLGVCGAGIAAGAVVGSWRVRRSGAPVGAFMNAVAPALLVAQGIGRIGDYFKLRTVWQAQQPAVGTGDQQDSPAEFGDPRGRPEARHLPAVVPVRADLRPGPRRRAGLARPPPAHKAAGPVRPLRRRVLRVSHFRGDDQDRLLGLLPGAAAELLHRRHDDRHRAGLVR
jgi:hypothetical protein